MGTRTGRGGIFRRWRRLAAECQEHAGVTSSGPQKRTKQIVVHSFFDHCLMQQGAATRAQNRQLPDGRPATVPWQVGCSARLVACLAFLHVVGGLSSQCSQDYIAWPQEQCTLPCPEQQVRCGYDTTIPVTRYQSEYCCLCIPSDAGTYKPFLCAGSAWPQPTPAEVSAFNFVAWTCHLLCPRGY